MTMQYSMYRCAVCLSLRVDHLRSVTQRSVRQFPARKPRGGTHRTFLLAVQAHEEKSPSEPSDVKTTKTPPPTQDSGSSPAEKQDQSAAANTHPHDTKQSAAVRDAATGQEHGDKQKQAEEMMDEAESGGGHGYS